MAPQDPLLSHLISRLEADINFLSAQGHISSSDAQTVLGVLSRAGTGSVESITNGLRNTNIGGGMPALYSANSTPAPYGSTTSPAPYNASSPAPVSFPSGPSPTPSYGGNNNANTAPPMFPGGPPSSAPPYNAGSTPSPAPGMSALKRPVPPPPPAGTVQAKALWDYNLDGQLKDDLTFRAGDIIQIVKEENGDWWTGRLNGREGMFPSNHVEKLPNAPGPSPSYTPSYTPSYGYNEKDQYQQPQYAPPPGPPVAYQQGGPVQQQPTEEEKKKGKFGKLGGLMATSAAGGLGFGAGAAVGGGIINSIF
ncbi:intersectin third Src-like 3 domain protein [Ceratobasidium sp. AG-Ba]|nr:intersectin third Src-like 3 domain protein [Ceratobasidium sp. AG-Ba]